MFGFDEVVQALIDEKASVNICNSNTRNTALYLATTFGKEKVVKLLLKNDADLNMVNNEGKTALDIANTIEDKAKRATIIKLLTAQKVNLKDGEDKAITTGEKTRKRKCVRKAPDNLNQHHANNLRFFALECNFLKVKELLEKGANPNWVAKEGDHSPIMLAVLSPKKDDYKKIEIIALLYKYGAKIDLESFDAIFKNKVISADLCENIRKLNAKDPKEFSVEEFLESLPKPGGGLGSNPRKRPS